MKYIPELTGLRGLAALMVFVAHASKDGLLPEFWKTNYGIQAVFLFFMLSGFLMGQLYLEKKLNSDTLKTYLTARVARIFPLYLVIIIASFFISNFIYADFRYDFRNPFNFVMGLFFIGAPKELWTVPIEVQFYFCFILFWYFYSKEKRNKFILIAIPIFTFLPAIAYILIRHQILHRMPTFSLFFFAGVLISILNNKGVFEIIKNKTPRVISTLLFLLVVINLVGMREVFGIVPVSICSLIVLILFFILVTVKPADFFLLRIKPMLFMGEISYSFYMIHRPVMKFFLGFDWSPAFIVTASLFTTALMSYVLYKIIEVPARKFITKKFSIQQSHIKV